MSSNNIVASLSDKGGGDVVIDPTVCNQKLLDLLDDHTYEQISSQTILKNGNNSISLTRN